MVLHFSPGKQDFCLWKEDRGSAFCTYTVLGAQLHVMNHVQTAMGLQLLLPAIITALLLGQARCTGQWDYEICPRGKQDKRALLVLNQFMSLICFRAPAQPQQPWQRAGRMTAGSSSISGQIHRRGIIWRSHILCLPECWLWSSTEHWCLTQFRKVIKNEGGGVQMDRQHCR